MSIEQIDRSRTMPGGEVLNEIAFVLLAGIIVGTCSVLFGMKWNHNEAQSHAHGHEQ